MVKGQMIQAGDHQQMDKLTDNWTLPNTLLSCTVDYKKTFLILTTVGLKQLYLSAQYDCLQ